MFFIDELMAKKLIKLSAYDALMKFNVCALPVDPIELLNSRDDIVLYAFSFFQNLLDYSIEDFMSAFGPYGAATFDRRLGKYFLYYNNTNSDVLVRWTLVCLLASIELGSVDSISLYMISCKDGDDCDTFAYYFAAPDVILKAANICSPESIMKSCQIPFNKAHKKSRNLKKSWIDKKTYLDKILKSNFYDFIHLHKE